MHGLINRALQSFVCATYGKERWRRATDAAGIGFSEFEAMLVYDDDLSRKLLDAVCAELGRSAEDILEDLGTYLVSNPRTEALRRLLRFGGVDYVDFLYSFEDLPDRARLAVADLHLPRIEVREQSQNRFSLTCQPGLPGFGCALLGVLRAMADDYGALVTLGRSVTEGGAETVWVALVEDAFSEGRQFDLGVQAG